MSGLVGTEDAFYRAKEDRNILHALKEGRLTGLVASCVATAF
jgi:hypothetical protein